MSNINDLTIEQLLEIASKDGRSITTLHEDDSNVKIFLREYGITDGPALVPNYKVYHDYCKLWRPQGGKLSKIGFLRKFNVAFDSKRTRHTRYYSLNEGAFDISEASLNEAKEFDRRYRSKITKKNKQKKQGKVSRATTEVQPEDETGLY